MSAEKQRNGKAVTSFTGWLEVNEPSAFTLEDFRRLRAEGDKEDDRKAKA